MAAREKGGAALDKRRQQRLSNARQLAAAGFVDHAVKQYLDADEPRLAADLLSDRGRVVDAIRMLEKHDDRHSALMAAALRSRVGDDQGASTALARLGELSAEEVQRFDALRGAVAEAASAAPRRGRPTPKQLDALSERAAAAARARKAAAQHSPLRSKSEPAPVAAPEVEVEVDVDIEVDVEVDVDAPTSPPPPSAEASTRSARSFTPPRARPNGLRPPSKPAHEAISSLPPRRSGVYPNVGEPSAPNDAQIDSSIDQLLATGRMDAAARVAQAAGRHYKAAAWFEQVGDHYGAGASLAHIGWFQEAADALVQVDYDHRDYRAACRTLARCAAKLSSLDDDMLAQLGPYIDSGPRSDQETGSFLDLAELLWANGDRRRAYRCLQSVMRLDPANATAELMQLTWAAEAERDPD